MVPTKTLRSPSYILNVQSLTADQVIYFVTRDIYEKSKPDEFLLQFLEESIKAFSLDIENLLQ